jgi:predicted DNA-binding transcriptional regulator YafY
MRQRRRLALVYHSRSRRQSREHAIEPYALVYYAGDWHVLAADAADENQDGGADRPVRQFRLSRIEQPRLLDHRYEIPAGMDARAFWANNNPSRYGDHVARVRFGKEVARWARERRHYSWETEAETADGLVVTLRVERWEELLPWLLGWGADAEVLSPPELRNALRQTAESMLATYTPRASRHA